MSNARFLDVARPAPTLFDSPVFFLDDSVKILLALHRNNERWPSHVVQRAYDYLYEMSRDERRAFLMLRTLAEACHPIEEIADICQCFSPVVDCVRTVAASFSRLVDEDLTWMSSNLLILILQQDCFDSRDVAGEALARAIEAVHAQEMRFSGHSPPPQSLPQSLPKLSLNLCEQNSSASCNDPFKGTDMLKGGPVVCDDEPMDAIDDQRVPSLSHQVPSSSSIAPPAKRARISEPEVTQLPDCSQRKPLPCSPTSDSSHDNLSYDDDNDIDDDEILLSLRPEMLFEDEYIPCVDSDNLLLFGRSTRSLSASSSSLSSRTVYSLRICQTPLSRLSNNSNKKESKSKDLPVRKLSPAEFQRRLGRVLFYRHLLRLRTPARNSWKVSCLRWKKQSLARHLAHLQRETERELRRAAMLKEAAMEAIRSISPQLVDLIA